MEYWIRADKELPEYNEPVLTYDENFPSWIQPLMLTESEDGYLWAGLDSHAKNLLDSDSYVCDDEYTCTHWKRIEKPQFVGGKYKVQKKL